MAMSAGWQAQRIKTTYLKHKVLHDPVCIMEEGQATTGRAAEEAIADEESRTESESDGAPDAPSGSAPALCSKQGDFQASSCWTTRVQASQRTQPIFCHTSVTHQIESVRCAAFSVVHLWGQSY